MRLVDSANRYRAVEVAYGSRVFEVVPTDGLKLEDLVTQLLGDRRVARLNIHLATDDSYAGRVVRFNVQ